MNKTVRQVVFPIIAAFIWGSAFLAQGMVTESVQPFTFNAARSLIAVILLFPLSLIIDFVKKKKSLQPVVNKAEKSDRASLFIGGAICGVILFFATNLQQIAIGGNLDGSNSEGIVAFITAFYMVIVPVIGLFFGKKNKLNIWISVIIGIVGLYFVCVDGTLKINSYNLFALGCAFSFAFHIIAVDVYSNKVDCIKLSCVQFAVNFVISVTLAIIFETIDLKAIFDSILPILYVGAISSTIAYTLQIAAQKGTNPTVVSLLMCLESVFALLCQMALAVFYPDKWSFLTPMQYVGCGIMFLAVVLAQVDVFSVFKEKKT